MSKIKVALSHYCCRTTLQCQCHVTVLESCQSTGYDSLNSTVLSSRRKASREGMSLTWQGSEFQASWLCLFTPQLLLVLITPTPEGWPGWVNLDGWFFGVMVWMWKCDLNTQRFAHPSSNRAQRRLTMLIKTNVQTSGQSKVERCSAISNFSRAALGHVYFSRGELRERGRGVRV